MPIRRTMKTELSHNKIALYKSEKLLGVFMITLFSLLFFLPINSPPFSLPYYFISPYLFFSSPNVLSR